MVKEGILSVAKVENMIYNELVNHNGGVLNLKTSDFWYEDCDCHLKTSDFWYEV